MKQDAGFNKTTGLKLKVLPLMLLALGTLSATAPIHTLADSGPSASPSRITIRDEQSRKLADEILALEKLQTANPSAVLSERIDLMKKGLAQLEQGTTELAQSLVGPALEDVISALSQPVPETGRVEVSDQWVKLADASLVNAPGGNSGPISNATAPGLSTPGR